MSITVEEALKTEGMKRSKLIAGEKGLKREIRCIDTMEMPDIKPWLQKNEFLMTTGYSIQGVENGLLELLDYLHESGAAGLAITTQFIGGFTDEVKQRADELQLPLVEIPSDVPFIQMTNPLMKAIVDKQNQMLEFSNSMNQQFVELEINGGGFQDITNVLHNLTGYDVLITDLTCKMLAFSQGEEIWLKKYVLENRSDGNIFVKDPAQYMETEDEEEKRSDVITEKRKWIKKTVYARKKAAGYIFMFYPECDTIDKLKIIAMHHAAVSTALEFAKRKALANNQQLLDNNFFGDLLEGSIQSEEEIYHRSKALKWPIPYRIMSFDIRKFEEWAKGRDELDIQEIKEEIAVMVKNQMFNRGIYCIVTVKSDVFSCIISTDYEVKLLKCAAKDILDISRRNWNLVLTAGISSEFKQFSKLKEAFLECNDAIKIGRMHNDNQVVYAQDVLLERTFMKMGKNDFFQSYVKDILGKLQEYDRKNGVNLMETLESLIDHMGARNETAKALFLHRNTLAYRIKKIEALTGYDLENNNNLFMLGLALKLRYFI